jgi:hypothetical protein
MGIFNVVVVFAVCRDFMPSCAEEQDIYSVEGYDRAGKLITKVLFKEPTFVRPYKDEARNVFRHNIT